MTTDRDALQRRVRETTEAQGVPYHVEDPATLAKVAALLDNEISTGGPTSSAAGHAPGSAERVSARPSKPRRRKAS